MSGWDIKTIEQVVDLRRGFDLPTRDRRPGPYPVLSSGVTAGWHDEGPVKGPGMVIGRATNLGDPTWSDSDFWPLNTTLYVADFCGNEPRWVFHLFEALDVSGYDSGSVQPMLNRNYIARLPVTVPPRPVQRAIAEVLGALDDKIAANTDLARTANLLANTRFEVMSIAANLEPLTKAARFVNGRAFTKGATGTGRIVVRIAELNSGIGPSTVYNDIAVGDEHLARPGDILFAWSGSLTLHRWARPEAIINQHIFKVLPHDGYPPWLVYELIRAKLDDFKAIAADKATTMGHIQRRHLDEPVAVPTHDQIAAHGAMMQALWDRRLAADQESLALATLRDTLLPHLMSGRLQVKDAEQIVSDRT